MHTARGHEKVESFELKTRNQIPHPATEAVFQLVNFPEDQNLSFQF